jgi:hypothetical protein
VGKRRPVSVVIRIVVLLVVVIAACVVLSRVSVVGPSG